MIINHEFVENEVTPEMVLGLKPSLFNKKDLLSCSYHLRICKTQEKPIEMGNFKSFASTFVLPPFNVPHAFVNVVSPTNIAR